MALIDLLVVAALGVILFLAIQGRRSTGTAKDLPIDPETQHLRDEIIELRARIHVLERALTDNHGAADLTQEIDRLRDR